MKYVYVLFAHDWCTVFGYLYLFLYVCKRVVDESYEEYPAQFTEDPEQQFVEEGKCPWSYVLFTLIHHPLINLPLLLRIS